MSDANTEPSAVTPTAPAKKTPEQGESMEHTELADPNFITLVFKRGERVHVNRVFLEEASPVLKNSIALLKGNAQRMLRLEDDDDKAWKIVLKIIRPVAYPPAIINWDNVEQVLLLADKYDMPIVRGFCAHFLALHSSSMALHEPLSSARNPLRPASLADRYCSTSTELSAYRLSVDLALTTCLSAFDRVNATAAAQPSNNNNASSFPAAAPSSSFGFGARTQPQQQQQQQPTGLFGPAAPASSSNPSSPAPATPGASDASRALAHLEKLVNDACYMTTVTPSVQKTVMLALMRGLRRSLGSSQAGSGAGLFGRP